MEDSRRNRSSMDMHHSTHTRYYYQRRPQRVKQGFFVDIDEAVEQVVVHNERMMRINSNSYTPAERAAIYRMEAVLADIGHCKPGMGPQETTLQIEVTMASFGLGITTAEPMCISDISNDLDIIFFGGVLRGHIKLSWGDRAKFGEGYDYERDLGYTEYTDIGQCDIVLNDLLLGTHGPWTLLEVVWSTLLHEMCHAVLMTRAHQRQWNDNPHDARFCILIHAVHKHSFQRFVLPAKDEKENDTYKNVMREEWADDSRIDADEASCLIKDEMMTGSGQIITGPVTQFIKVEGDIQNLGFAANTSRQL